MVIEKKQLQSAVLKKSNVDIINGSAFFFQQLTSSFAVKIAKKGHSLINSTTKSTL